MKIICAVVGDYQANCYVCVSEDTSEAIVIDPGDEGEEIWKIIEKEKLTVKYIVNTHGHSDHIGANRFLRERTGAQLLIHEADASMLIEPKLNLSVFSGVPVISAAADRFLKDGDTISIGKERFTALHTPGHTKGGISLIHQNHAFTGDTLFAESIGRTDFPGGSMEEIIEGIQGKLMCLDDAVTVYPGHGPSSSIGHERAANPFLVKGRPQ